jgi:septal ring factor EnvC (AmiA/AmiB activator)
LFGLAGSLVLGFLDLLSARTANRFYTELEDWLSGMTRLSGGGLISEGEAAVPAYVQALLEQTADGLERMQRAIADSERERRAGAEQLAALNQHLGRLGDLLAKDSRAQAELVETQQELRQTLRQIAQGQDAAAISDELRQELRLLARTIAAALEPRHSPERSAR